MVGDEGVTAAAVGVDDGLLTLAHFCAFNKDLAVPANVKPAAVCGLLGESRAAFWKPSPHTWKRLSRTTTRNADKQDVHCTLVAASVARTLDTASPKDTLFLVAAKEPVVPKVVDMADSSPASSNSPNEFPVASNVGLPELADAMVLDRVSP